MMFKIFIIFVQMSLSFKTFQNEMYQILYKIMSAGSTEPHGLQLNTETVRFLTAGKISYLSGYTVLLSTEAPRYMKIASPVKEYFHP
jgi:hypothetical protein